jgi:hypothetical protein
MKLLSKLIPTALFAGILGTFTGFTFSPTPAEAFTRGHCVLDEVKLELECEYHPTIVCQLESPTECHHY